MLFLPLSLLISPPSYQNTPFLANTPSLNLQLSRPTVKSNKLTSKALLGDEEEEKKDGGIYTVPFGNIPKKMIVFDKDGTLGDDSASLKLWADKMTSNLIQELKLLNKSSNSIDFHVTEFHQLIGWDSFSNNLIPSAPLAAGIWEEQLISSSQLFHQIGIEEASQKVSQWHDNLGTLHGGDKPLISNLREMMIQCKQRGLKVAICTSDDRPSTDKSIMNWDLEDLIDYSICGNEVRKGKPNPDPLYTLCQRANLDVQDCIIVGDTTADSGMARNAGAGLMVGVLTGSGTSNQLLKTGAHVVIPDVGDIPQLLDAIGMTTKIPEEKNVKARITRF